MFCPNCGNNCADANFCSNCGIKLCHTVEADRTQGNKPSTPMNIPNLDTYYQRFYPNKIDAISALRIDTGMGFREAYKCIDFVFAQHHKETEDVCQHSADTLYCPKCFSDSVLCKKKGFDFTGGWLAERILPGGGFLLGAVGANDLQYKCLNCGHQWEP